MMNHKTSSTFVTMVDCKFGSCWTLWPGVGLLSNQQLLTMLFGLSLKVVVWCHGTEYKFINFWPLSHWVTDATVKGVCFGLARSNIMVAVKALFLCNLIYMLKR
jgi:hypothetical protein